MSSTIPDPYKTLGVAKDADVSAVRSAYRKLVLKCHPDKCQDPALKAIKQDEFQRVQQAYEILSDDTKRREYDDEVNLKELREKLYKEQQSTSSRPSKTYYEYNVRTAEPPSSFKAGPPPGSSPYSSYPRNGHPYSSSWESRDIPTRSKPVYEEDRERKARRAASYEKEKSSRREEDAREDRRRRREAEELQLQQQQREKEKARARRAAERAEDERRELEERRRRERDREARKAAEREAEELERRRKEEKRARKEQERAERDRRERERDLQRRKEQEEKLKVKKPAYVEQYDETDEDRRASKTKTATPKKHEGSPRREKSTRREIPSLPSDHTNDKMMDSMASAAEYMTKVRRKGSKSDPAPQFPAEGGFASQYPDPEQRWNPPVKARRASHDEKFKAHVEPADEDEAEVVDVGPDAPRPPLLKKAQTFHGATGHLANMSAQRSPHPHLPRSATMDTRSAAPPTVPAAPVPEKKSKSDRRPRRPSMEDYDDDRHSSRRGAYPSPVVYKVAPGSSTEPRRAVRVGRGDYLEPSSSQHYNHVKTADYGGRVYVSEIPGNVEYAQYSTQEPSYYPYTQTAFARA